MYLFEGKRNKKLDGISHGKTVRRTTPLIASQPSNNAKIRKDIEPTKQKLIKLAKRWEGVNKVRGFLSELWDALGIYTPDKNQQKGGNPSRYAAFQLQDGMVLTITIRASAHNAKASTYLNDRNVNGDTNISIVLQTRLKKDTFEPHDEVKLQEYVYADDRIASVKNPLSQIAMSLVGYLSNGNYIDTTGVAISHISPQPQIGMNTIIDNNGTTREATKWTHGADDVVDENKSNIKMNKKQTIRLNESQFNNLVKKIVKESVNKILNEVDYSTMPKGDWYERNEWWKQQLDKDFPEHDIEKSRDWRQDYSKLEQDKIEQDKITAKAKKKEESERKKQENALKRKERAKAQKEYNANRYKKTRVKYENGRLEAILDKELGKVEFALIDSEGYPEEVWGWDAVELYTDDTWLPYEESFRGFGPVPKQLKPYFLKMLKKIGMRNGSN